MKIRYTLTDDIVAREAAQLNWEINKIDGPFYIIKNERMINAKSMIGLLSGNFHKGDTITIEFESEDSAEKVKEIFDEIGREENDK